MKRLIWRRQALADLQGFHDWLATIEGAKPKRVVRIIRLAAESLRRLGDIGRPGVGEGLRELSVRNAPYVIVYRFSGDEIEILAV
ncbi:MAG: type II toxin-antitoxin system RelE/ParE family toxin [Terricaulis sp.]|nr:type II toxin-antitoxin system RelE/ParE family toxin [Terricaulis sp.]